MLAWLCLSAAASRAAAHAVTPPALLPGQSFSFAAPSDAVSGGVLLAIVSKIMGLA